MPASKSHPLYQFLKIGREDDLLEPCPFDDTPSGNGWMVLAEAPSSYREYRRFEREPTWGDAEEVLFSKTCIGVVEHWLDRAYATADSELAAALRNRRSAEEGGSTLGRTDVAPLRYPFYEPLRDDDMSSRLVVTFASSFLGHLLKAVQAHSCSQKGLTTTAAQYYKLCLAWGAEVAVALTPVSSDVVDPASGLAEPSAAWGRVQSCVSKLPVSELAAKVLAFLERERYRQAETTVRCLFDPRANDGEKAKLCALLATCSVAALSELLKALRDDDSGLDVYSVEAFENALGQLLDLNSWLAQQANGADGEFDAAAAFRELLVRQEGENHLLYSASAGWQPVKALLETTLYSL